MVSLYANITKRAAGTVADVDFYDNVIFKGEEKEIRAFIREMGFDIREIPMNSYLPDRLGGLKAVPQAETGVRKVFEDMNFWELTVREGFVETPAEEAKPEDLPFAVETELQDKSRFKMTGISKGVREILETTGFDQFFV